MAHIESTLLHHVSAPTRAQGDITPSQGNPRTPPRRGARALVTGVAAAAVLTGALGAGARAEDAHINEMIFDIITPYLTTVIQVTSSNGGDTLDTITPAQLAFWAHRKVDTRWPGYVEQVGVFLGRCTNTECGAFPLIDYDWPATRDYDKTGLISFSTDKLSGGKESMFATPYREQILSKCNAPEKPESFLFPMSATFSVNTRKDAGTIAPAEVTGGEPHFNGGDATRHGVFLADVKCVRTSMNTADPRPDPHRTQLKVTDLDLFLTTVAQPGTSGRGPSGTQCKPLRVTTRIETDKAGPVNVKLWRKVDNGPTTSEAKQMQAAAQGGGQFGDDWVKWENFTKTTTVQYKAEVLGGTFAPSTPWKSITIHCNGDYAAPTSDANPDNGKPGTGSPGSGNPNGNPGTGKPKQGEPRVPTIVTPTPVACIGGKVEGGACECPRAHALVKKSSTTFQCVKTAPVPDKREAEKSTLPRRDATPKVLVAPDRTGSARPMVRPGDRASQSDQRRIMR
jgi:hypothetical protein